jgi:hypothetical protein
MINLEEKKLCLAILTIIIPVALPPVLKIELAPIPILASNEIIAIIKSGVIYSG